MTGVVQVGPLWRITSARMPTKWGMFSERRSSVATDPFAVLHRRSTRVAAL
jgi:hypothetical protein